MKELEEFAKAISAGMKSLAHIIKTAADQLEEHIKAQPEKEEAQEVRTPPQGKAEVKKEAKPSEKSAEKTEVAKAPENKSPGPKTPKAKGAKIRKSSRKSSTANKKKTKKTSATETVYLCIKNAEEAINIDELSSLTGFDKKKLHNILHRLKKSGKIKSPKKAVYTAG